MIAQGADHRQTPARTFAAAVKDASGTALLALGLANAEIGQRLGVSAKTVRNVVSVVQRKLGVGTRAEAIEVGREAGLGRSAKDPDDPLSWLDDGLRPG